LILRSPTYTPRLCREPSESSQHNPTPPTHAVPSPGHLRSRIAFPARPLFGTGTCFNTTVAVRPSYLPSPFFHHHELPHRTHDSHWASPQRRLLSCLAPLLWLEHTSSAIASAVPPTTTTCRKPFLFREYGTLHYPSLLVRFATSNTRT
jgi:hypothetical protein